MSEANYELIGDTPKITHINLHNYINLHLLLNLKGKFFEPAVGSPNFARMCGYRPY